MPSKTVTNIIVALKLSFFLLNFEYLQCCTTTSPNSDDYQEHLEALESQRVKDDHREKALERLQEVLGLPDIRSHESKDGELKRTKRKSPPQFMMELYKATSDPDGILRALKPFNSSIVRSYVEKDSEPSDEFFYFNISSLDEGERLMEAQLHLYRVKVPIDQLHPSVFHSPFYLINLYQVLPNTPLTSPEAHRLLDVHYVGAHKVGWEVFNVKAAVTSWVSGKSPNLGLIISTTSLYGDVIKVKFARKHRHHHSKQPILVLFNQGPTNATKVAVQGMDGEAKGMPEVSVAEVHYRKGIVGDQRESLEDESLEDLSMDRQRRSSREDHVEENELPDDADNKTDLERLQMDLQSLHNSTESAPESDTGNSTDCSRHTLYVDFRQIGWDSWIISPKGYNAFYCGGGCNFPLGQNHRPTNHATVQGIVHELGLHPGVNKPCCVPTSLLAVNLLYFDEQDNVVLKQYEDMVAATCGCH